ncbi:PilZ domain-containing protein [Methylobacterium sp. J-077]|uniref:PilZ domain-containing protein n=1 Tax=Methylobacterium sp. J-077 TaxID=2836656 RepID=UPI001FBB7CEF|nr:PilZ domain-containing protein [Methylobacterium sp. J-077]MCJ2124053.1 PilZ domain-containing protein [Methylobacterium sp. J-077]
MSARSARSPVSKAAVISHGGWMAGCTIVDISVSGARLLVSRPETVPDQFELATDLSGGSRRCRAVWREGGQIGVEFVDWL